MIYHDDNGYRIHAGDRLNFAYGIPPTGVWGIVERINGVLYVLTQGHNPPAIRLKTLLDMYNCYREE